MTRNILSNRFFFAAVVLAFALAVGLNAAYGKTAVAVPQHHQALNLATDPNNPPDNFPGAGSLALATDPNNPPDNFPGAGSLALATDPNNPPDNFPGAGSIAS